MSYQFNETTLVQLQQVLANTLIIRNEKPRKNTDFTWVYFSIQFTDAIELIASEEGSNIVDIIVKGNKHLNEISNKDLPDWLESIEVALRWEGQNGTKRHYYARGIGFGFKVKRGDEARLTAEHFPFAALADVNFIDANSITNLQRQFEQRLTKPLPVPPFFTEKPKSLQRPVHTQEIGAKLQVAEKYIDSNFTVITPRYSHASEKSQNPAYHEINGPQASLGFNQTFIWLLREDLVLAAGIKNAYRIWFDYDQLSQVIPDRQLELIDWDDRAGHPTLTTAESKGAYYGGYISQRKNSNGETYLEILLFSGRFARIDEQDLLSAEDTQLVEAYLATKFVLAFGEQAVVFRDLSGYKDYFDLSRYTRGPLPDDIYSKRTYTLDSALDLITSITANKVQAEAQDSVSDLYSQSCIT